MYSLTFHPTHLESSLHVRRVRRDLLCNRECFRIIPPCTEGTVFASTARVQLKNHPSAYGGYERRHHGTNQRSESSLRIRRVPLCRCTNKFCDRIIPPHTEGTPSPGQALHRTPNHPSAYGGYCLRLHGSRAAQESSLPIRRVLSCRPACANERRIIPPHTEGTYRPQLW